MVDDTSTKKFTQEVRIASETGKPLEWLVGGYFTSEKSFFNQDLLVRGPTGATLPNTFLTLSIPSKYREHALFGDLTVHLGKAFDVTAGIRYAWNRTTFEQIGSGTLTRSAPRTSSSDQVATYLLNARYRMSDRATAYVRYATGYRPGGPNIVTINPATGAVIGQPTFDSDRLESYEAGFKYETADHSFGLDLAAFYIDWDNIIVNFTQNGFAARTNVTGGATSRGGELTLTARPTRGFVATAALAYQRARLSEASTVLRAAKGERLPGVPKFTASVNADYEWDMGAVRPSLGASLRFVDDRRSSFNAATSVPQYRLPAYEAVDLRAGLTFGHVKAQIYARNLFDVKGQLNTRFTSPAAGPITLSILPPRTVGASVTVDF